MDDNDRSNSVEGCRKLSPDIPVISEEKPTIFVAESTTKENVTLPEVRVVEDANQSTIFSPALKFCLQPSTSTEDTSASFDNDGGASPNADEMFRDSSQESIKNTKAINQNLKEEAKQSPARHKHFQISPAQIQSQCSSVPHGGGFLPAITEISRASSFISEPSDNEAPAVINISHDNNDNQSTICASLLACKLNELKHDENTTAVLSQNSSNGGVVSESNATVNFSKKAAPLFFLNNSANAANVTDNYDTVNTIPSLTCESNSATIDRPPNIYNYSMTVLKTDGSSSERASMPQLMHRSMLGHKPSTTFEGIQNNIGRKEAQRHRSDNFFDGNANGGATAKIYLADQVDRTLDNDLESFSPRRKLCAWRKPSAANSSAAESDYGEVSVKDGYSGGVSHGLKTSPSSDKKHYFDAVFIPAFTNIVGTLLYLRMGYVAGQAGILVGVGIVLFSTFVIGITALSLSAICSNGKQLKGGVYYIISRSMGAQVGGVISIIFSLANVGMGALYIVGIAEFISDLLTEQDYDFVTLSRQDDIRLFSMILCLLLMLIVFAGPDIENGFTLIFFSTYILSYINWLLGTLLPVSVDKSLRGVTGYSWVTTRMNLWPDFRNNESVITVFAVFFPGFTGMLAGVMYVDQLRNPGRDVGMGLFTSIATTGVMYVVAVIACGATMLRDASGLEMPTIDNRTGVWHVPHCANTHSCRYGLMNFYQVAELTCAWRPLIVIGMFGMTISSTMTNMDQGPQNLQAACKDAILPYMRYFAKEFGRNRFPRRAYVFLAMLTMLLTLIGDLNELNEIVTNMFMATYTLVNYACFDASFVRALGWRPLFPFYNMWVSLFGAGLCVIVMFIVSVKSSITIFVMFASCFAYFHYYHPEVDWGDSHQAHVYKNALSNLLRLSNTEVHVKNYRPQILLLSGNPVSRLPLLDFAHAITKGDSLLICSHILNYPHCARIFGALLRLEHDIEHWLRKHKFKCFYQNLSSDNFRLGVAHVFQICGLGRLRPNVLLLGFKSDWIRLSRDQVNDVDNYVGVIRDAFENNYGVLILRNGTDGFDLSEEFIRLDVKDVNALRKSCTIISMSADAADDNASEKKESRVVSAELSLRRKPTISHRARKSSIASEIFYSDRRLLEMLDKGKLDSEEQGESEDVASLSANNDNTTAPYNASVITVCNRNSRLGVRKESDLRRSRSEQNGIADRIRDSLERQFFAVSALSKRINEFHKSAAPLRKIKRIDVWWLYDDGGLTILIPHLLRLPKSYLEGASLRVLTLSGTNAEVNEESIIALLIKFRIEFNAVKVIEISKQKLNAEIWYEFMKVIKPWRSDPDGGDGNGDRWGRDVNTASQQQSPPSGPFISGADLSLHKKKTLRQLLTRQLLMQYSYNASLIVVTLPVPNEMIGSCLYMAWLDIMTRDLPPVLMVRGNQTSVLTFYS